MILVDTSVWVAHLRSRDPRLSRLLDEDGVVTHPWVVGEIACGSFANRTIILEYLQSLPRLNPAQDEEVLTFLGNSKAFGTGIGYIDAHLLTAALIDNCRIWTVDKRMASLARQMNLDY